MARPHLTKAIKLPTLVHKTAKSVEEGVCCPDGGQVTALHSFAFWIALIPFSVPMVGFCAGPFGGGRARCICGYMSR